MASSTKRAPLNTAAEYFDKKAASYERLTGGCTREVAQFLLSMPAKLDSSSVVLDNACGTGIITEEILTNYCAADTKLRPRIHAADAAPSMVSILDAKAERAGWKTGDDDDDSRGGGGGGLVQTSVEPGEDLSYADNTFTHSYTNLGIMVFPDPEKGAAQIYRTLRPGGTAFVTTWQKLGYAAALDKAQRIVRPDDEPAPLPIHGDWLTEGKLRQVLVDGGFEGSKVRVETCSCSFRAEDLDGLLDIMRESFTAMVTVGWSGEEREAFNRSLADVLSEEQKASASFEMVAFVAAAEK